MQALTLADYQKVVGEEWRPLPGFKVVVRGEWKAVVTAVFRRTVVVCGRHGPRADHDEECRTLHRKEDVVPTWPLGLRWMENREADISYSLNSARRPPEILMMDELKGRLGLVRFRLCPCGVPAVNATGYPRCAECSRLGVNAAQRKQYWKGRAPRVCPCGSAPTNAIGRPRCDACRKAAKAWDRERRKAVNARYRAQRQDKGNAA